MALRTSKTTSRIIHQHLKSHFRPKLHRGLRASSTASTNSQSSGSQFLSQDPSLSPHPHSQLDQATPTSSSALPLPNSLEPQPIVSNVPVSMQSIQSGSHESSTVNSTSSPHVNPFHTHVFFTALEKTFPSPVARTLMSATRGMLVDRILKIRRDGLTLQELDNQAYLYRAAQSELRTEFTMRTRNQTATILSAASNLRREVDALDSKMKEDISGLKHDIQLEMDNHRNESRGELKKEDLRLDDVSHNSTVTVGDLRTEMEQAKWDNTRRGVFIFGSFVLFVIIAMELRPSRNVKYPPQTAVEAAKDIDADIVDSAT